MEITLLGFRVVNFENNNGEQISGRTMYLSWPMVGENAQGAECQKFFVADGTIELPTLIVARKYIAGFNPRGKLMSLADVGRTTTPASTT